VAQYKWKKLASKYLRKTQLKIGVRRDLQRVEYLKRLMEICLL